MLALSGCRVKVEDLPLLLDPHVCELTALQQIDSEKERLIRKAFPDGKVTCPFYLLVKICDAENRGTIRIALYTPAGKRLRNALFHFGKTGEYYHHITCFERFQNLPPGTYRVAVFVNDRLRDERPMKIFAPDPG